MKPDLESATPVQEEPPPPSFATANNLRQQARAAGLDPDYWYPVAQDKALRPGKVLEVRFWKSSIALYRGRDGRPRSLENRCAHRWVKLSLGNVEGNNLVCGYHGWAYDGGGKVVEMAHDLFGKKMPSCRISSYPVAVRYGLIWIFPGDPALAEERSIPDIPELESDRPWPCARIDFVCRAHHSLVAENINDFTHAYLHRKYKPFIDARLVRCEDMGDRVLLSYATKTGQGKISRYFVDRSRVSTDQTDLCYEYPYHWANTDSKIRSWTFLLPIDEQTTHAFFLFYFDAIKIPLLPFRIPRWLMNCIIQIGKKLTIRPILDEDVVAIEAEQVAYRTYFGERPVELNPAVPQLQRLTVRKWKEHLARKAPLRGLSDELDRES